MKPIATIMKKPAIIVLAGIAILGTSLAAPRFFAGQATNPALPIIGGAAPVQTNFEPSANVAPSLNAYEAQITNLAAEAGEAVVHIRTVSNTGRMGVRRAGEGSGFIARPNGWIVTNDHVVDGAAEVTVILRDGRELKGKVYDLGDPSLDIALVKVEANNLPILEMADSNQVRPGQFAMAIGAPFGLENTVTIGHVSGLGRSAMIPDETTARGYFGMIQTDASINPGNSGGPLIDINGRVIGVNSYIFSSTGSNQGIGFSIPSNLVRVVSDKVISTGRFQRAFLGLVPDDIKPYQLREMGLSGGARVTELSQGSPAAQAGIRNNDIITAIDGKPIQSGFDVRLAMMASNPGQTVRVDFRRGSQTQSANVRLQQPSADVLAPQNQGQRQAPQSPTPEDVPGFDRFRDLIPDFPFGNEQPQAPRNNDQEQNAPAQTISLGVTLRNVGETERTTFKLPAEAQGLVIMSVVPGGFADRLGLMPGDIIRNVDGTDVQSVEDVRNALRTAAQDNRVSVDAIRYTNGQPMNLRLSTIGN